MFSSMVFGFSRRSISAFICAALATVASLAILGSERPVGAQSLTWDDRDVQAQANPRFTRLAHLSGDPVAGRLDYVVLTGPLSTTDKRTYIQAWANAGTPVFNPILTSATQPVEILIDVIDLDGDGNAEIVGIYPGDSCTSAIPALYVFNGDGSQRVKYDFPVKTDLSALNVVVYDVLGTSPLKRRIVVAPNTGNPDCPIDFGNSNTSANVYFFDFPNPSNWSLLASPSVARSTGQTPCGGMGCTEIMTFPGVLVGDIDNSGSNEIVVIVKSRILVFSQDGIKRYYKQVADSDVPFSQDAASYNTDHDTSISGFAVFGGRRYGVYKLINIDTEPNLELVIAADGNPIVDTTSPGALYQAYDLPATSTDGYMMRTWGLWDTVLRGSTQALTPTSYPSGYVLGVPLSGIDDINGDGIPEIVTSQLSSTPGDPPNIVIINARTGSKQDAVSTQGGLVRGVCLDVLPLRQSSSFKDLILYNPNNQKYNVWRPQSQGSVTFEKVAEIPAGTLSTGVGRLVQRSLGDDFALPVRLGTNNLRHYAVQTALRAGVLSFVGYNSDGCPASGDAALYSWTANPSVERSVDMSKRPGRVLNTLIGSDPTNSIWMLETETTCVTGNGGTDLVNSYIQSGSNLVIRGDLAGTDTIGVYRSSTGTVFMRNLNTSGPADLTFSFGAAMNAFTPLAGDWDGDGDSTIGLYDPATGNFFLRNSNSAGGADLVFSFGAGGVGYLPITGDWNYDGIDTIGLYDPATGNFFLRNSNSAGGADLVFGFGAGGVGFKPITGDWNGDGVDTIGLYLPSSGSFFLRNANSSGSADLTFNFGAANSTALAGDWNGDGSDSIGTYVAASSAFFLRDSNSAGAADYSVSFGTADDKAIVGNWNGQ